MLCAGVYALHAFAVSHVCGSRLHSTGAPSLYMSFYDCYLPLILQTRLLIVSFWMHVRDRTAIFGLQR